MVLRILHTAMSEVWTPGQFLVGNCEIVKLRGSSAPPLRGNRADELAGLQGPARTHADPHARGIHRTWRAIFSFFVHAAADPRRFRRVLGVLLLVL